MTAELDHLLALDAANRGEALDIERSFIVQAPAGAGKTELLTQRFLTLLKSVENPEEIVALTFTNKAAAEMRDRVLDSLRKAHRKEVPTLPHKKVTYDLSLEVLARNDEKKWSLLDHAGRLQITTLDALCGRLARQMPLLSRFGGQPAVVTDAEDYYRQAASNTLNKLDTDDRIGTAVANALTAFDNDRQRLENLLISMLGARDQWLSHAVGHRGEASRDEATRAMASIAEFVLEGIVHMMPPALQSSIIPTANYVAKQAIKSKNSGKKGAALDAFALLEDWTTPLGTDSEDLPLWWAIAELVLTGEGKIRSSVPSNVGLTQRDPEGPRHSQCLKDCFDHLRSIGAEEDLALIRKVASPLYTDTEWALIEDMMLILKDAAAELWLVFQEVGKVDFIQIAQNALQALGSEDEPTDLALQLDYKIQHLLVDEFQDTSPTQVELLSRLTSGWQPTDHRTLFLVGDPMQSIYRFRKADVSLFLQVHEHGIGGIQLTPLQLYRNNRSHEEVVGWVNDTFPGIFSPQNDTRVGAVSFEPAAPTKGSGNDAGVAIHAIIGEPDNDANGDEVSVTPTSEQEAKEVVQIIRATRAEDPQRTIAVLVRARTHLTSTVAELKRNAPDLPFQAVEIEGLGDRQCILDLVALTRALHHRADRVNWLAILRAPWCGLELRDLHTLAGDDLESTVWQLINDDERVSKLTDFGRERILHLRGVLNNAFDGCGRQRPRRWIEGIWQCLNGPLCLKSESDFLDVQAYFRLLDQLDDGGKLDLPNLDKQLEKLYAAPDPNGLKEIQIMTIHKAKGLEFDTVILPGLHKIPKSDDQKLLIWDKVMQKDGHELLAAAIVPTIDEKESGEPSKYDLLQEFEKTRSANEAKRVLYVAVTRAIRKLHLVGVTQIQKASTDESEMNGENTEVSLKPPPKSSLLRLLWPKCEAAFKTQASVKSEASEEQASVPVDPTRFRPKLERLKVTGFAPDLELLDAGTSSSTAEETQEQRGDSFAADIGILTHRYLELIATDGLDQWSLERVEDLTPRFKRWFNRQGYPDPESKAGCEKVLRNLRAALSSERGQWILASREIAACEYPVTSDIDGIRQAHIIDRTFVEAGIRWIIDYKTTEIVGDPEEFFESKKESYRDQLARYTNLFSADGLPVKAALYFPEFDKFMEFDHHAGHDA